MTNAEENCEMKMENREESKLKCEMIWKIQKKIVK
jgi:hypothetical protein